MDDRTAKLYENFLSTMNKDLQGLKEPWIDPVSAFAGGFGGAIPAAARAVGKAGLTALARPLISGTAAAIADYPIGMATAGAEHISPKLALPVNIVGGMLSGATFERGLENVMESGLAHLSSPKKMLANQLGQVDVWHGSPHRFDKFSTEKIGAGEGAQSFGWGLYFTDERGIAEKYAEKLGKSGYADAKGVASRILEASGGDTQAALKNIAWRRKISNMPGASEKWDTIEEIIKSGTAPYPNVYKATLFKGKDPSEYRWLDWDKNVPKQYRSEIQSQFEKEKIDPSAYWGESIGNYRQDISGSELYRTIETKLGGKKEASLFLQRAGIDGIRYPAGTLSGVKNSKAKNYVVFDENAVTIEGVE